MIRGFFIGASNSRNCATHFQKRELCIQARNFNVARCNNVNPRITSCLTHGCASIRSTNHKKMMRLNSFEFAKFRSTATTPARRTPLILSIQRRHAFTKIRQNSSTASNTKKKQPSRFLGGLNAILLAPRIIPTPRWITPHRISFNLSECFGHFSFVLVALSYATDDFLLLRTIAVAGSSCMMVFTYFHPHGRVLWLPFKWNALFILINSYRIGNIMYHKYLASKLSDDLKRIKNLHFDAMELSDYVKLINVATEETYIGGTLICQQGQKNPYIRLVIQGELEVFRDGVQTYNLIEGNFVSEVGLHAGLLLSGDVDASCTVIAKLDKVPKDSQSVRVLRWHRSELISLLTKENELRRSLTAALSWDIVRKLKGQRELISTQVVDDPESWTKKRKQQSEERYVSILQNILQNPDNLMKRRDELNKYRIIHNIDDERHKMALEKCGWTPDDYEAGNNKQKNHENNGRS